MSSMIHPVLKNGVGAFVPQCRRIVFHYCERSGSSRGMIEYLKNDLFKFAKEHPHVEVIVNPRPSKHPVIRGLYLNGKDKVVCVRNMQPTGIAEKVSLLKNSAGNKMKHYKKPVISTTESVRGICESRINRAKQLLKWFIEKKSGWNAGHEYALMILGQVAVWHMDFTHDTVLLSHAIDELYTMGKFSSYSTTIFKEILSHSDMDADDGTITRLILLYTRSDVVPSIPDHEFTDALYASRRFYFDCVYIHNKNNEVQGTIKPQHVYDRLTEMEDPNGHGYFFEMTRALRKFVIAMAELLASPSMRGTQDTINFQMMPPPSTEIERDPSPNPNQQQLSQQLLMPSTPAPSQSTPQQPKRTETPGKYLGQERSHEKQGLSPFNVTGSSQTSFPEEGSGSRGSVSPLTEPAPE
ncbi:39S ribosomal protein L43, mitochondrial [Lunasporangiospora selenospora]|uniref:Large ribosomal subunit protein mL43 n=1 Tax=Lunasporangiospora selenospora TaxID=979761 RepID=A0A9P6FUR0_9FUNG|nr:39S ribosomal protein L43, mitochondrial [Lunasporangiospora selenospora]